MNKFMKIMLSLVLVFSIATINFDASSNVTKYDNGNVKTRTYYNGSKKTKQIEYTSTGRKSMMYTFNSNGKVYTKYYYDANGKQNRSYRYDSNGRKSSAYDYKTVNGKRVIVKKWDYTTSGKKSKYQQYYDNGKLKSKISYNYYSNGKVSTRTLYYSNGKYKEIKNYYSDGSTKRIRKYNSSGHKTSDKSYSQKGSGNSGGSSSGNNSSNTMGNMNSYETQVFNEINSWRKAHGYSTVKHSNQVHSYAETEVKASSASNPHPDAYRKMSSYDWDYSRAIQAYCGNHSTTSCSAKSYVSSWANSSGHRDIMAANWDYMSVAYDNNDIQVIFVNDSNPF